MLMTSEKPLDGGESGPRRETGFALFRLQYRALLAKNLTLAWRNKVSTLLQIASSFIFIFLIFAISKAIEASIRDNTNYKDLPNPGPETFITIPACEDGVYIKVPCYDFLWSGNASERITQLVESIALNNPGRPIDLKTKAIGFATPADVDEWLLANPYRTTGALHFEITEIGSIAYGIQTNSTVKAKRGKFEDKVTKYQLPLQVAAERAIARELTNDPNLEWTPTIAEFAHPAVEALSAVGSVAPTFLFAAAVFAYVIQISNIVGEKELKLRQAMATMGLMDSAYWASWFTWEIFLSAISSLLLVLFGMMYQFDLFIKNDFFVLYIFFFLFSISMIGFAFMFSAFLSKTSSAMTFGFISFLIGFICLLVIAFGFPYTKSISSGFRFAFSLFPPNLLGAGLSLLGDFSATSSSDGLKWSKLSKCPDTNDECVITMGDIYRWYVALAIVFALLALYFDNVLPDANGVRKSAFYFLLPSYWTGKVSRSEGGGICSCTGGLPPPPRNESSDDEDVAAEAQLVQEQAQRGTQDENIAISVRGLIKTFPGIRSCACCCRCRYTPPFHAVKGTYFHVEKNKLFCLLGPNGAGKSTTINCLTGIIPTTDGDALIYGNSIRDPSSVDKIRRVMGVCPQFDILWESLSGRDHLRLFASIKGLPRDKINDEVENLLAEVNLTESGNVRSSGYSGGMKRRLSVAVALIGDPQVVFLDEPTTGMDPITRRSVWDIIERAKRGRAIVLTTHSMEEADILGDRIAIMARGKLRCIGTSIHLKNRFGTGYNVNVSINSGASVKDLAEPAQRAHKVKQFFKEQLGVDDCEENYAYLSFLVPREKESLLASFFQALKESKSQLGIFDVQLSLTTLEDVFLTIARKAELETAQAEGRFETITLPDNIVVKVPIGATEVPVPQTASAEAPQGSTLEVQWQQDEAGVLRISFYRLR